ncbi:unnamed protein product, partial [Rotaria sp. Silwood1]
MDNTVRESLFVATRKTLANDLYGEFCLIWLDPNCRKNEDNDDTEKRLRGIDSSLQVHSTIEESVNYIEEIHPQRVFIIISGSGQLLPMDELNSIRTNQSGYIAMNTFLSTSLSSAVAADFQGNGDQRPFLESVIFEIKIDFSTLTSPTVPFALISQMSTKPDEQEVVFSIGSVFRIDSIDDDIYPLWHIKLTLDSKQNEVDAALDNYTMALEMLKQIYGSDYRGL